ncbi:hypothetical protein J2T60_001913 [Natronospira proteinivora]|uniref:Uncharacterized protein n=1 Tax=Natronospira proteinivora TaxID=1807133 RepID=A0ABT1GCA6_9GAMM|nr:hypothetical protein [Natronospira proteinivora]MCP1727913.1 hypothetical protein [Natronospira proteinivora]
MARLSEEEKQALKAAAEWPPQQPASAQDVELVAPTPEARMRYIRFATEAARLHRPGPIRPMRGEHWKL